MTLSGPLEPQTETLKEVVLLETLQEKRKSNLHFFLSERSGDNSEILYFFIRSTRNE